MISKTPDRRFQRTGISIQAGLQKGLKVAQIAKNIGKNRATIGREIKAHRRLVSTSNGNNCIHSEYSAVAEPPNLLK